MVIVVGKWKEKLIRGVAILIAVVLFAAAVPKVAGVFNDKIPVFSGWMQDEHPSGNPMRVEQQDLPSSAKFNDSIDQFVIQMQNFYHEEKE